MRAIRGCCMIAREGRKESMRNRISSNRGRCRCRRSRRIGKKMPFEIVAPTGNTLDAGKPDAILREADA